VSEHVQGVQKTSLVFFAHRRALEPQTPQRRGMRFQTPHQRVGFFNACFGKEKEKGQSVSLEYGFL
jgi:hypothetical protein